MIQDCRAALWVVVVFLSHGAAAFQQSDYNLTSERMDLKEFNNGWVSVDIKNFKYNRTHAAINITFETTRPIEKPEVAVQAYRFASNEYRLFPLAFKSDLCQVFAKNDFGLQNMFSCGNFKGCPVLKKNYEICNWIPDESKFPPHIPSGRYMVKLNIIQEAVDLAIVNWYLKIEKKFHYI